MIKDKAGFLMSPKIDFKCIPLKKLHTTYHIIEDESKYKLTDVLEIHFLELPKLFDKEIHRDEEDPIIQLMEFIDGKSRGVMEMLANKTNSYTTTSREMKETDKSKTEKTDRLISIQDLDDKYGSLIAYIPTYKAQECQASGYFIYHPNVVGKNPKTSESTNPLYAVTEYYDDKPKAIKNVYNHYKRTMNGYILEYSIEQPTIDYEEEQ